MVVNLGHLNWVYLTNSTPFYMHGSKIKIWKLFGAYFKSFTIPHHVVKFFDDPRVLSYYPFWEQHQCVINVIIVIMMNFYFLCSSAHHLHSCKCYEMRRNIQILTNSRRLFFNCIFLFVFQMLIVLPKY